RNPDGSRHYVGMPFHLFDTTNFNIISNLIHKRPTQKTKVSSIRMQALSVPPNPSKISSFNYDSCNYY
ncbi:MAG: hypothetical protein ACRD80_04240, partial [Nitrososphaeraceae archaeon]